MGGLEDTLRNSKIPRLLGSVRAFRIWRRGRVSKHTRTVLEHFAPAEAARALRYPSEFYHLKGGTHNVDTGDR